MTCTASDILRRENLNKIALGQISGKRGPFQKSIVKVGLKQRFRHQNWQLGYGVIDSTRGSKSILKSNRKPKIQNWHIVSSSKALCWKITGNHEDNVSKYRVEYHYNLEYWKGKQSKILLVFRAFPKQLNVFGVVE